MELTTDHESTEGRLWRQPFRIRIVFDDHRMVTNARLLLANFRPGWGRVKSMSKARDNMDLSRVYGSPRCPQTGKRTTGPFSPPIGQLRESLVLSARDEEAAQAVAVGLRDAKAANTRRVYASAWHEFNV